MLCIVEEACVGEAFACRHGLEDEGREGRDEAAGGAVILHVEGGKALGGLVNGGAMTLLVHDAREVKIRELAQDEAVYLVERIDIKGEVSSPGEVVEDVAHASPFALVCHAPMMPRIADILAGDASRLRHAFTTAVPRATPSPHPRHRAPASAPRHPRHRVPASALRHRRCRVPASAPCLHNLGFSGARCAHLGV